MAAVPTRARPGGQAGVRPYVSFLAAAAGAAAAHAAVAAAVSGQDAAAEAATGGVAQVDDARERVGGVDGRTSSQFPVLWSRLRRGTVCVSDSVWAREGSCRFEPEVLEQQLLLAGQETQLEPAEDVVHDALGVADVRVAGPAAGFEAGVGEFFAE